MMKNFQYPLVLFTTTLLLVLLLSGQFFVVDGKNSNKVAKKKKSDVNDNKGLTPFFLQDPYDQMCLGGHGFTVCDENALWVLTKRSGKKTYSLVSLLNPSKDVCLQRKTSMFGLFSSDYITIGSCSIGSAQAWEFEFVDQRHVRLSNKGHCLVRGKKGLKNSISVQNCKEGEFIPLVYHPTAVHENGFYLKSADDKCFDGSRFIPCSSSTSAKVLWGVGIKYVWGEAHRYLFSFYPQERSKCIVAKGSRVEVGACDSSGALKWALDNGRLTTNNGQLCLARKVDDTATLVSCKTLQSEHIALEVPATYSNDQLAAMLQSPNLSDREKEALTEAISRKSSRV